MANHSSQKTYYEILEISPDAQEQEIKDAYRKLVSYWHPDLGTHERHISEHQLKLINEAYSNLKTRQTRDRYNQVLKLQQKASRIETATKWDKFWRWLIMNESNNK
ncbi:MAG TPA: DnaJ domain-containing protein [Alphaproteobacteria bacterium]|nr:DnaJ domain-containing protein [Alphaproteobacteria bacterium]HNS44464.1 DnaJ domain-containing protein [Alphaproteobacteria bacterium]